MPEPWPSSAEDLAACFKALGDAVRIRLVLLLARQGELCVCHLTEALGLPQSTVSRHLAVLRAAQIVRARKSGRWMHYRISEDLPPLWKDWIAELARNSGEAATSARPDCPPPA